MESEDKNWKLKLRYAKLQTPYKHYTLIAEGIVGDLMDCFHCRKGSAFMAMKVWASSHEEAFDMMRSIGRQIGFETTGRIHLYDTDPTSAPRENPYGYDIKFTPFDPDN